MNLLDTLSYILDPNQPKRILRERRNQWKRAAGWLLAVCCWLPVIGLWAIVKNQELSLW